MTPHDLVLFLRWRYDPRYAEASDGALLEQYFAARDELALRALVSRHAGALFNLCRVELGDLDAAEDAFQDTIIALHRHGPSLRRKQAVLAWLLKTARRICIRKRAQRDRRLAVEYRAAKSEEIADAAEMIGRDEERRLVARAIGQLPDRYGVPLHLGLHGLSAEQIGETLRLPVATVKTRITRGRRLLLAKLKSEGVGATVVGAVLAEPSDAAPRIALIAGSIKAALADVPPVLGLAASASWLKPALGVMLVGGAAAGGIGWGMRSDPPKPVETATVAETVEERNLRLLRTEVVPKLAAVLQGLTLGGDPPKLLETKREGTLLICLFEAEHKPFGQPDAKPWFHSRIRFVFETRSGAMRFDYDPLADGRFRRLRMHDPIILSLETPELPRIGFTLPGVHRLWRAFDVIEQQPPEPFAPVAATKNSRSVDPEIVRPMVGKWYLHGDRYRPLLIFVNDDRKICLINDFAETVEAFVAHDEEPPKVAAQHFGKFSIDNDGRLKARGRPHDWWVREAGSGP